MIFAKKQYLQKLLVYSFVIFCVINKSLTESNNESSKGKLNSSSY